MDMEIFCLHLIYVKVKSLCIYSYKVTSCTSHPISAKLKIDANA